MQRITVVKRKGKYDILIRNKGRVTFCTKQRYSRQCDAERMLRTFLRDMALGEYEIKAVK